MPTSMPAPRLVLLMLQLLIALAVAGAGTAAAGDSRNTLLIIDGSGSMWGRFETP